MKNGYIIAAAQEERFTRKKHDQNFPSNAIKYRLEEAGISAGVSMITSLVSLITNVPVKSKVVMTGEITLRGNVLPIGGVKEKVTAAHRAGIKEVVLPFLNQKILKMFLNMFQKI